MGDDGAHSASPPALGSLGRDAVVYPLAKIVNPEHLSLGDHSTIDDFVFFNAGRDTRIGRYVHVAAHVSVIGGGELEVGDYAVIATGARILTASDSDRDGAFMTTHAPDERRAVFDAKVTIGAHAFVGANAVVMPGVTLGEGSVAGAGAVVTRDLEPWTVYVGAPARPLRVRPRPAVDSI
jgi:acetyltransferase-like isoleucine patch superfamily enzyme